MPHFEIYVAYSGVEVPHQPGRTAHVEDGQDNIVAMITLATDGEV